MTSLGVRSADSHKRKGLSQRERRVCGFVGRRVRDDALSPTGASLRCGDNVDTAIPHHCHEGQRQHLSSHASDDAIKGGKVRVTWSQPRFDVVILSSFRSLFYQRSFALVL